MAEGNPAIQGAGSAPESHWSLSRRDFLRSAAASATAFLTPPWLARPARAAGTEPVVVALYLRGGADFLNIAVPVADPEYTLRRPTVHIPAASTLALDSFFGLNPAFADLLPMYQSGELLFIQLAGSTDPSRSHFDAQDFMERAAPGNKSVTTGWLSRYLEAAGAGAPIQAVSMRPETVKALIGDAPSIAMKSIADYALKGVLVDERRAILDGRYQLIGDSLLGTKTAAALGTVDLVSAVDTTTSVVYPDSKLGNALKDTAALIKADIGVRVVAVDMNGWDHHSDLLLNQDLMGPDLSSSLAAFRQDLGADAGRTLVLCMTEFGREVGENGADGTDHGRGGGMIVLGAGIAGGRVILKNDLWPGLATSELLDGRFAQVTTDFRDVFAEALDRHVGFADLGTVFPGFSASPSNYPGMFA